MNNELQIFKNQNLNLQIRAIKNDDGSISVNLEDAARGLGFIQTKNKKVYIRWETVKGYLKEYGVSQQVGKDTLIPESVFYLLAMKANNVAAKKFQIWVATDVLPAIRKTGGYVQENREEEFIKAYFPSFGKETQLAMVLDLRGQNEKLKNKNQKLLDKIERDKPLNDFAKKVGNSSDLIDMNQMAKLLKDEHMDIGRNRLFEFLRNKGILRKNNEPYQRFLENGLFNVKESTYNTAYGPKVYIKTYVTGKGQIYITELLRRELSKNNNQKQKIIKEEFL